MDVAKSPFSEDKVHLTYRSLNSRLGYTEK